MNIAVYGAGQYGKYVKRILEGTYGITVPCFYDSDKDKWNKTIDGIRVNRPDKIGNEDGIIVAIKDNQGKELLEKELNRLSDVRVYKNVYEIVAETIFWDVSGFCNAKCNYCITGRMNSRNVFDKNARHMTFNEFKLCYDHLYEHSIISRNSCLGLYNWRESFLNPDIMKILKYLSDCDQRYALSTNGSVFRNAIGENTYNKCDSIIFSMPGFSQASYDRAHGFNFESILNNIELFRDDMINNGFKGKFIIAAHKYKYSIDEIPKLCQWAEERGIEVNAYFPYLAGNSLIEEFILDKIDDKRRLKDELYFEWTDILEIPTNFHNPLCDQMTIDEEGRWTLCCVADPYLEDFATWGTVFDVSSYQQYLEKRKRMLESDSCRRCREYGMAYRILNN